MADILSLSKARKTKAKADKSADKARRGLAEKSIDAHKRDT